jgi:hypothetical protein
MAVNFKEKSLSSQVVHSPVNEQICLIFILKKQEEIGTESW